MYQYFGKRPVREEQPGKKMKRASTCKHAGTPEPSILRPTSSWVLTIVQRHPKTIANTGIAWFTPDDEVYLGETGPTRLLPWHPL
jgi:hypothetical protein